ncbi:hypothetical protein BO78DRAFT_70307 [Aspergillus sclerotiicarbonarius CBS 121057]|uniref:Uncharacterized protein n=1 Tax=Aspergillus sclerotiicarbonarius (strain CBS 121057 / IBT 28362) TaxID=1448318 RepID=A0A319EPN5_ASPSB|nr:hypothetical protein BO78DRAFT_70307 [Aspergillus sclerotiicarbonarius CBS 121057]
MAVLCIPCCLHSPSSPLIVASVAGLILIDTLYGITKEALPKARDTRDQLGGQVPSIPMGTALGDNPCSLPGLCAGAWLIDSSGPSTRARSSGLHDLPAAQTVIHLMPHSPSRFVRLTTGSPTQNGRTQVVCKYLCRCMEQSIIFFSWHRVQSLADHRQYR